MSMSELIGEGNIVVCSVAGVEVNGDVKQGAIPSDDVMELHRQVPANCPMLAKDFGEAALESCVLCIYAIPQLDPALAK
jgi:hypothetical protein